MMRICQVCHLFHPHTGGIETHVYEISKRLAEKFDVEVITTDPTGKLKSKEEIEGFTVRRFKSYAPSEAYYFSPALYIYLKKNSDKYDVIHAHNYHAFPSLFAALAKGRKFVFTPHYHGTGGSSLRSVLLKLYKPLGALAFRRADAVILVSDFERELVRRDFGVDGVVIPNGIDLSRIERVKPFETSERFIFYIGRLEKYKNVQLIIEAMKFLDDFRFYIAGRGSYENELKTLAKKNGVEERVRFLGFVSEEEKYRWLKACSVFVNLSSLEAFGITVLEALACGKPAIVSGKGALREFAKFKGVFVVNKINPEELAKTIRKVAEIKVRADLRDYDWENVVDRIIEVYLK